MKENKTKEVSLWTLEPGSKEDTHWKEISSTNYEDSWMEKITQRQVFPTFFFFVRNIEFLWDICLFQLVVTQHHESTFQCVTAET